MLAEKKLCSLKSLYRMFKKWTLIHIKPNSENTNLVNNMTKFMEAIYSRLLSNRGRLL